MVNQKVDATIENGSKESNSASRSVLCCTGYFTIETILQSYPSIIKMVAKRK